MKLKFKHAMAGVTTATLALLFSIYHHSTKQHQKLFLPTPGYKPISKHTVKLDNLEFFRSDISSTSNELSIATIISRKVYNKLNKYGNIPHKLTLHVNRTSRFMTCNLNGTGRLGNKLFQVATVIALALENNMIPYYEPFSVFNGTFAIPKFNKSDIDAAKNGNWSLYVQLYGTYSSNVFNLSSLYPGKNILLGWHVFVYRYLERYQYIIKQEFIFPQTIRRQVVEYFLSVNKGMLSKILTSIWIGVHVRRGDKAKLEAQEAGYRLPNPDYYERAFDHMRYLFGSNLIFIICGEDQKWNKKYLGQLDKNVVFSSGHTAEVDLAILSSCDHVITSVGTYSWWAAFLASGHAVYYSKSVATGSRIEKGFRNKDVYPPNWVGIP